jgi:hypothetical protein
VLFGQKAMIWQQLFTDALEYAVVPYPQRFRKPDDDCIKTRQIKLPGAPPAIRPPVEARKRWGDPFTHTFVVDGIEDGSKTEMVYVEALLRGHGREIPGETIKRPVMCTGPGVDVKLIRDLPVPVKAGSQTLTFRLSLATKRQELDTRYVSISPEKWRKEERIAVSFKFERPFLRDPREVQLAEFEPRFNPRVPAFMETDGACAENDGKMSSGGWGAVLYQEKHYCKLFGPKADTSNNEMEYRAMLEAV